MRFAVLECPSHPKAGEQRTNQAGTEDLYNMINDVSFGSEHPAGCHFAVADGSVAFVTDNIDMNVLLAIASREGAEPQTAIQR